MCTPCSAKFVFRCDTAFQYGTGAWTCQHFGVFMEVARGLGRGSREPRGIRNIYSRIIKPDALRVHVPGFGVGKRAVAHAFRQRCARNAFLCSGNSCCKLGPDNVKLFFGILAPRINSRNRVGRLPRNRWGQEIAGRRPFDSNSCRNDPPWQR